MAFAYIALTILLVYLGYSSITSFIASKPIAGAILAVLFLFFGIWFYLVSYEGHKKEKKEVKKAAKK